MDSIEGFPKRGAAIWTWLSNLKIFRNIDPRPSARKNTTNEVSCALLQLAHVLLQAIRMHAVAADQEDLDSFRNEFERLNESVSLASAPDQILLVAGSADQALSAYNRQITRYIRSQRTELQRTVATLTETVTTISNCSERSYAQLEDIGWRIQKASVIEDIRVINIHLAECLQTLREETLRQKVEAAKAITQLKRGLNPASPIEQEADPARPLGPTAASFDANPSGSVADRGAAENALRCALEEGGHTFAAVFVVKGMHAIEARSGPEGTEQAAKLFLQALNERFNFNRIYRWGQSCFVSLLERAEPLAAVQMEISRIISRRIDITIEARGRSTFIPLCSSATAIPIFNMRSMEILTQQIDALMRL